MTPDTVGPLSRSVQVDRLPAEGTAYTVEATAEEREALARDFGLPAIHALTGEYRMTGTSRRVHVTGHVKATITQTCVVTLDPFDSTLDEDVEVDFVAERRTEEAQPEVETDLDAPDAIVDGRIDLGSLTAEFLALGLDPYPRKPGANFEPGEEGRAPDSPFAALSRLKGSE